MIKNKLTYKATDAKWTIWDCPDKPFTHNHEFFRFAIELPVYDKETTTIILYVRPAYTLSYDKEAKFACVYEMEYEANLHGEVFSDSILYELIINDCYPAFVEAFDKQKTEFSAVKLLPAPRLGADVLEVVKDGAVKALRDGGYP